MVKLLFISFIVSHSLCAQGIYDLARSGTVEQMRTHLKENPLHINQLSENGLSPFLLAAYHGNNDVAVLLIEKGADLSYCYKEGSAIYALIYKNNIPILEEIIGEGVNVNDSCQFEQLGYPIHFALSLKRYAAVELLLKNNVDLDVKDQQGRSIAQLLTLYNDPKFYELFN